MSILIEGIKMPTSCAECPMGSVLYGYKCLAKNKQFDRYAFTSMQDWCPLIEIPDKHGRLIDADELTKQVEKWLPLDPSKREEKNIPFETDICVSTLMEIEEAPTIIEAEPCNDLSKLNNTIFAVQNADEDEWPFAAKPIDYMHTPSVEEIIEGDGFDSFIKHFED